MDGCSCPNISGFVLNITDFCLNMTGIILNMTGFVIIITEFFLYMTVFNDDYDELNWTAYMTVLIVS